MLYIITEIRDSKLFLTPSFEILQKFCSEFLKIETQIVVLNEKWKQIIDKNKG